MNAATVVPGHRASAPAQAAPADHYRGDGAQSITFASSGLPSDQARGLDHPCQPGQAAQVLSRRRVHKDLKLTPESARAWGFTDGVGISSQSGCGAAPMTWRPQRGSSKITGTGMKPKSCHRPGAQNSSGRRSQDAHR